MKTIVLVLLTMLLLVACGSAQRRAADKTQAKAIANSPQTKKAEAYARTVAEACVNKGGSLRRMIHCAIPRGHGRQFMRCAIDNAPKKAHDKAALEGDLVTCGEKFR